MRRLIEYQKEIHNSLYISNLLNWELRVNAPKESKMDLIDLITKQELYTFNLMTSDEYIKIINSAMESDEYNNSNEEVKRSIKYLKERYEKNKKVPSDFYSEYCNLKNVTNKVWEEARLANDYNMYKPYLIKMIEATKKYYRYIDSERPLYDVMLDKYEMGMTSEIIDKLFNDLKKELVPLLDSIKLDSRDTYTKSYTKDKLMRAGEYLLNYIGFDMNRGTLGIYPHGFTERMADNDVRIAFNHSNKPLDFVSTMIHEGGHGIFEQNIDKDINILFNESVESLYGLHESQSRFYENILGRNKNFWIPIYDDIKDILKLDMNIDEFVSRLNSVKKGFIRTEADELTYCLHIIIRYEIERDIFNNDLDLDTLDTVWNNKVREYLKLDVNSDNDGLMQDVHWSEGEFGYFPSYLLGTIYDGMYISAIENNLGSIDELLKSGRILEITKYLNNNIHIYGGVYNSSEVIKKLCNREITSEDIIKYFKDKYLENNQ